MAKTNAELLKEMIEVAELAKVRFAGDEKTVAKLRGVVDEARALLAKAEAR